MNSKFSLILYIIACALCPIALGFSIWFVVKFGTIGSIIGLILTIIGTILIAIGTILTLIDRKKNKFPEKLKEDE